MVNQKKLKVKNYGMGKLKWVCCEWGNSGKYGELEHSEFKKIHPFLMASVNMWASGEVEDKNGIYIGLEFDREKIDYFYVTVELSIV